MKSIAPVLLRPVRKKEIVEVLRGKGSSLHKLVAVVKSSEPEAVATGQTLNSGNLLSIAAWHRRGQAAGSYQYHSKALIETLAGRYRFRF